MYKVIIVDDEDHICQGLSKIIDWNALGFEIVCLCHNAIEAISAVSDFQPHLIVTDVKMPGQSGLDMIKNLRKNGYTGEFIITSGYADFQYAQKAMQYHVSSYLLKPIDERELITELYTAKKCLDSSILFNKTSPPLNVNEIKKSFLCDEISISTLNEKLPLHEYIRFNSINKILLIQIADHPINENTKKFLASSFSDSVDFLFSHDYHFVFGYHVNQSSLFDVILKKLNDKLNDVVQKDFIISIGRTVRNTEDLKISYHDAMSQLECKFCLRQEHIIYFEHLSNIQSNINSSTTYETGKYKNKIIESVSASNKEKLSETIKAFQNQFIYLHKNEIEIKTAYLNIVFEILEQIEPLISYTETVIPDKQVLIEKIYFCTSLNDLSSVLNEIFLDIIDQFTNNKEKNSLDNILYYIDTHLSDELSLDLIAQKYHYNKTYLGRKFKSVTGFYFNDYLNQLRIEHSVQLLDAGLKIQKVAEMIGYKSADYFNIQFKKIKGISPSSYKKLCSKL